MTGLFRIRPAGPATLALVASIGLAACGTSAPENAASSGGAAPAATLAAPKPARGGQLTAAVRTDPQSLSWFTAHDMTTLVVSGLTEARLVRVNRATEELEPWLAESWTEAKPDAASATAYAVRLRPGLTFSDGHPLSADDVVFSLRAAYEAKGSVLEPSLVVGGRRLTMEAADAATVIVRFPAPFGPGLRLLDNLPILPRHRLEPAVKDGTFAQALSASADLKTLAGAGPFVFEEYVPGQRMVFARNPRYFRKDAAGVQLPYLDRLTVRMVPDQNAQVLQLEGGQIDLAADESRPEDYAALRRAADAGRLQLVDLGAGLDAVSYWMNLKPGAFVGDPRAAWIQRDELRQAISLAVDRQLFADTVYYGAAVPVYGPITEANKTWHTPEVPRTPHDPARARALLQTIGLADRNGDGMLEDAKGAPARFALLTAKGQTALERGAKVIADELRKIGLTVDVAGLEGNALVAQLLGGKYDAIYFGFFGTDTDPALNLDYWLSSGNARVWNLGQKTPATPWERRIDELMMQQVATSDLAERKRLFAEVQKIFAEHLPIVHFAVPRIFVAASTRVINMTPSVARPQLLWAADTLAVRP